MRKFRKTLDDYINLKTQASLLKELILTSVREEKWDKAKVLRRELLVLEQQIGENKQMIAN